MTFSKTYPQFKTRNLDLAAAVMSSGVQLKVKRLGDAFAEYSCQSNAKIEDIKERFLKGLLLGNIVAYSYARIALKRESAFQSISYTSQKLEVVPFGELKLAPGVGYWFYEGGQVGHAVWAGREPHLTRSKEARIFASKAEAEVAMMQSKDAI